MNHNNDCGWLGDHLTRGDFAEDTSISSVNFLNFLYLFIMWRFISININAIQCNQIKFVFASLRPKYKMHHLHVLISAVQI